MQLSFNARLVPSAVSSRGRASCSSATACIVRRSHCSRTHPAASPISVPTVAAVETPAGGDKGGGPGLLERADLDLSRIGVTPSTESGYGSSELGGNKKLGGGDYRVLLLDDPAHTEKLVVQVVTTVVPGVSREQAQNCYRTSQKLGMAIVTTCIKEHAEHYSQQLAMRGCRSSVEPDTTTI